MRQGFRKEADLNRLVKDYLCMLQSFNRATFKRVNTTGIPTKSGGMRPNSAAGLSDYLVWFKNGPMVCIECKSATGVLSEAQRAFKDELAAMGHPYLMIRTLEELETYVTLLDKGNQALR